MRTLLRCLSYLHGHWMLVAGSYLLLLLNNGITLATPLILRTVVDRGIRGSSIPVIRSGTLLILGLTLVRGIGTFLSGRWTEIASQNVAYDLRNRIHEKLQSLSFSYHDRAETGQLLVRAITDVDRVRFLTGRAIVRLVEATTLVIGVGTAMLAMNSRLALVTLTVVPFLVWQAVRMGHRLRPLSLTIQQQTSVLATRLEQNLRGARIVKAFAQERNEIQRFEEENWRLFDLHRLAARVEAFTLPSLTLTAGLGTVVVLLFGGWATAQDQLTVGGLVAFITYVSLLLVPVRRMGNIVAAIAQAVASGERIFEILDARSEVEESPDAYPLKHVRGHIRFEHVSFAYFGRHRVLEDIDFEVQPGEVVALLGATGSGKSTIINLIPRFYDVTSGRITLDGHDIRDITLESLRAHIGIVLQDTILFATTIRENIAFGRPGASEEEIIAAAQAACAHDFIVQMPEGYDTLVGERGVTLSGGQKQRIAIARALLKDPRVLILDDATSSVDTETEAAIQIALARLMQGRTCFVIAQRLSTVRRADLILVLDHGRIAACAHCTPERSAHEELLHTSSLYAEIYHRQLRPQGQE